MCAYIGFCPSSNVLSMVWDGMIRRNPRMERALTCNDTASVNVVHMIPAQEVETMTVQDV